MSKYVNVKAPTSRKEQRLYIATLLYELGHKKTPPSMIPGQQIGKVRSALRDMGLLPIIYNPRPGCRPK